MQRTEVGLPADNCAFRYGYGLFETMLYRNGEIRLAGYHWERLFAGLRQLHFHIPVLFTPEKLAGQVARTVKHNKGEDLCRVRLQLYAGGGGLYSTESRDPSFVIECFPLQLSTITWNENGLVAGIAQGLAKSNDSLANLKSCNALIYAIAARQAQENKWNDALVCNTDGNIIESTIANLFWIKDGSVYTPPLSDGCIAGVMRRHILSQAKVLEKSCTISDLEGAEEVFTSNAVRGIRWVKQAGQAIYNCTKTSK